MDRREMDAKINRMLNRVLIFALSSAFVAITLLIAATLPDAKTLKDWVGAFSVFVIGIAILLLTFVLQYRR